MLHSTSEEISEALTHPLKITEVSNIKLSKNQILRITRSAQNDIEFLRSIKSTQHNLYFITEFTTGTIVMDCDIKDTLLFDHSIKDKLFVYERKDMLLIQELTSTYSLEYHIGIEKDLKMIQKMHIIEMAHKKQVREARRITKENEDFYGNIEKKKNLIICFDEVEEIAWNHLQTAADDDSDAPNPERLLISEECEGCKMKTNHIRFCRFSHNVQRNDVIILVYYFGVGFWSKRQSFA